MIEEAFGQEGPCECCGNDPADCICPDCPVCGDNGNPGCYVKIEGYSHLVYNKAQRMGQSRMKIGALKGQIHDEELYLAWLEQQPEDWKDE
jgi:hypothetical protein